MYKIILLTTLLQLVPWVAGICTPDCTDKLKNDKVEDPKDCKRYYICLDDGHPSDASVPCDNRNVFNPNIGECVPGDICEVRCPIPDCHMTCSGDIGLISDPNDCTVYYTCIAGNPVGKYKCPEHDPYFDGQHCVSNKDKCCSDLCTPHCYSGMIQTPDPQDCQRFYICEAIGVPGEDHHFSCDLALDEVFDIAIGRCIQGAQCKTLCDSSTPINPGTSTTTTHNPGGGCQDSFTCTSSGFFPQCSTCQPGYFECSGAGTQGSLKQCNNGYLFNTNLDFPYCVSASNCPYYP